MEEHKILGEGHTGIVVYPAIGCSSKTKQDPYSYVSKILLTKAALDELEAYQRLPDILNNILYYKETELCNESILPELEVVVEELNLNKKYLNMAKYKVLNSKYIRGTELNHFLENYKNAENQTNRWNENYEHRDSIPVVTTKVFIKLLLCMKLFYERVLILNGENYFHNDISSPNIMVNEDISNFFLIDFTLSGSTPRHGIQRADINTTIDTFFEIVSLGLYNETIKHSMNIVNTRNGGKNWVINKSNKLPPGLSLPDYIEQLIQELFQNVRSRHSTTHRKKSHSRGRRRYTTSSIRRSSSRRSSRRRTH